MRPDIEDLIADFDGITSSVAPASHTTDSALADIEYYIQQDSVTAALYKDYREASARYTQLDDGNDHNAAMREVARDMMDSAWSALQTRLIEVREGDETATAMRAMRHLRHSNAAQMTTQRTRENERQAGFRRQRETIEAHKEKERKEAADALLAYLFLFWFRLRWGAPKPLATPQPRSAFARVA